MTYSLINSDCLETLRTIPTSSVDAVITDPPYGLSFMGKRWDCEVPSVAVWAECLRVLKPGGHLLAFASTRTQHRMGVRIEDAGFEIRDMIAWVYGSGFPKSRNLDGDWQGWGTALKPALEPITVARKPLVGTLAENVLIHGTGALNIDACRVEVRDHNYERNCSGDRGHGGTREGWQTGTTNIRTGGGKAAAGRWPANLIHDGSVEVLTGFPQQTSGSRAAGVRKGMGFHGAEGDGGPAIVGSTGSAARFFYCAKASKADRGDQNNHPTVKPTELMRHLCRLVTPPGGLVLDPFMGSGSTGKAALLEGLRFIGIEREANYAAIAEDRVMAAFLVSVL